MWGTQKLERTGSAAGVEAVALNHRRQIGGVDIGPRSPNSRANIVYITLTHRKHVYYMMPPIVRQSSTTTSSPTMNNLYVINNKYVLRGCITERITYYGRRTGLIDMCEAIPTINIEQKWPL